MPPAPRNPASAGNPAPPSAQEMLASLLQEPAHPQKLRTWLINHRPGSPTTGYVGYSDRRNVPSHLSQEAMAAHKARLIEAAKAAGVQIDWIEQNIWGERTTTTLYKPSALPSSDSPPSSSS